MLASSLAVLAAAHKALGFYAGTPCMSTRGLGYDYSLSTAGHSGIVLKSRLKVMRTRMRRLRQLRSPSSGYGKVVATGIVPSVLFGSETTILPPRVLTQLRNFQAKGTRLMSPGTAALAVLAGLGPSSDPECRAAESALAHSDLLQQEAVLAMEAEGLLEEASVADQTAFFGEDAF